MVTQTDIADGGCLDKPHKDLSANIVGEFTIDERHYLILLMLEESQTISDREVSRFEIQGQSCAIIEAEPASEEPSLADLLSERELQIATLVSLGRVNKQIAKQLHISDWKH